ncbi:hypothetical protein BCR36DRAFT_144856 [Piromyces finnis]|uniref:Acyltransferase 3 domain-containing protein n=1 Tax=Piromyces finnis TaxID=1754191 RepID=A0A1Y1UY02_9FUNG|nr:hypothetical protein BCR36DRAFT_144856 [Piromyces finnis]|eukprot:ORX43218.1 hypothetical protein BCR36DRAFT_144856 [Piromyces finnis]
MTQLNTASNKKEKTFHDNDSYTYNNDSEEEMRININDNNYVMDDDSIDEIKSLINNNNENNKNELSKRNKRLYWADCARIISTVAIIFLHCASYTEEKNLRKINNKSWIIVCIYNCICRFGVPLFVLLSGTFILDPSKNFTFKKLFRQNIFRLATAFIFWSFINAILKIFVFKDKTLHDFWGLLIMGEEYLWFILMIIGCYMISPFLRLFSDNIVLSRYFLGLCFFWASFIPALNNIFTILKMDEYKNILNTWVGRWHFNFTLEFVGYFVAGYHIVKYVNIKSKIIRFALYLFGIINIIFICISTIYVEFNKKGYSKDFRDNCTITIVIYSIILFIFFKHEVGQIKFTVTATKIINKLSGLTFGVYLLHMIVRNLLTKFLHISSHEFLGISYPLIIGCPIFCILITIISFSTAFILSKIPLLNKYIM